MAAGQMRGGHPGLMGMTGAVKHNVQQVRHSGQFYVTPEVDKELRHIESGVDHMRLDHDLLSSSKEWGTKFNPHETAREKQAACQTLGRVGNAVQDVTGTMTSSRISGLQDNEARESHYLAVQTLKKAEEDIAPHAHQSVDRIKRFCDDLGVTDRYTGYRHNLNRGNRDPVRLGFSWLDNDNKNVYNASSNVGWRPTTSTSVSRQYYGNKDPKVVYSAPVGKSQGGAGEELLNSSFTRQPGVERSIQERCGIITKFPGHTEYMDRYSSPAHDQTKGFIVNPRPDYLIHGRPLATRSQFASNTEYQTRYEFPDSRKIVKLPWVRK